MRPTPVSGSHSVRQGRGSVSYATTRCAVIVDPASYSIPVDDYSPDCGTTNVKVDKAALVRQLETLLGRPVHRRPVIAPTGTETW